MQHIKCNGDWTFAKGTLSMMDLFMGGSVAKQVSLPHDAMIHEERTPDTKNSHNTGFYPGGQYTYFKQLEVPTEWMGKAVVIEFEGVAGLSRVYINGDYAGGNAYTYTGFNIQADTFLRYGEDNEIKVEVNCPEDASRWYSGAGLYREVSLWVGGPVYLTQNGLKVTTPEVAVDVATVVVETELANLDPSSLNVMLQTDIIDPEGVVVASDRAPLTLFARDIATSIQRIGVTSPRLWDDETPNLYTCSVKLLDGENVLDTAQTSFGIRNLSLSAQKGLCVNGRPVKLRGSCIHHDNGVLGAATFADAEWRRCRQLKEAGFNCLRSSHHPMSRAMLEACDALGMYVIDELSDMWTRTKNSNDYANLFPDYWKNDLAAMIDKDYNHPSVIMYSLGNEIPEAGTARGAQWSRMLSQRAKALDSSRYTVNGINGLIAGSERLGEILQQVTGMSMDEMMASLEVPATSETAESGGVDMANGMAGVMQGPLADAIATSPIMYEMIDEFSSSTDVAGYNYLTALHLAEKQRRPNRVVLGAETFPADIVNLWAIVRDNPHVIGDMTWAGYDYLGEAGCGIFHYDGAQNFTAHWPDRLAGIGDIDILGYRKPISYLREIVYGLRKEPYMAVLRMDKNSQSSSKTPWMWKDNIASWTWPGYEGQAASVDVYADAEDAELLLNGMVVGRKPVEDYCATFAVPYQPGELVAIAYTKGVETGRFELQTAGEVVELRVTSDRETLKSNTEDLTFITIELVDGQGRTNLFAQKDISIAVEGGSSLQGFGSAVPFGGGSYQDTTWETYDGQVMAVLRAPAQPGSITLTVSAPGCEARKLELLVE